MNPANLKTESHNKGEGVRQDDEFFYNELADTTVLLNDGKTIKFNGAALVIQTRSQVLYEIFFGELRTSDVTDISEIDYDLFKTFLDCSMGFRPYTFENATKIFPIAWLYQIEYLIDQCIRAFRIGENTLRSLEVLSMVAQYNCDKLTNRILDSMRSQYNLHRLLEKGQYFDYLEPEILNLLLPLLPMDSHLLKVLTRWGKNYIENNYDHPVELVYVLEECGLMRFFNFENFETKSALEEFHNSEIGERFFTEHQVSTYIRNSENLIQGPSTWRTFKPNRRTLTEEIVFSEIIYDNSLPGPYTCGIVNIERNRIVFYNMKKQKDRNVVVCKVIFSGQNESQEKVFEGENEIRLSEENFKTVITNEIFLDNVPVNTRCANYSLTIIWTFLCDCRAFLMNRPEDESNDMYFTRNAKITLKRKNPLSGKIDSILGELC